MSRCTTEARRIERRIAFIYRYQGETVKHLLLEAKNEIIRLRRANELLAAKVEVVDVFAAALLGKPQPMGMAPDVVWALEKEIQKYQEPQPAQAA